MLKGTLEYHIGDTVYTLNEGDSIYVPPKTYHQLYNPTDEDVEAVAINFAILLLKNNFEAGDTFQKDVSFLVFIKI